jgi:murein DD-endopeptidase MepM/ murein hydrolase activator NlpD
MLRSRYTIILLTAGVLVVAVLGSCGDGAGPTAPRTDPCGGFGPQELSPYVLPYPVGTTYLVGQGNCTGEYHVGASAFAYDFDMASGELITAVRAGVVIRVREDVPNEENNVLGGNFLGIEHDDGTAAYYAHLTQDGAVVEVGESVQQGQHIAWSGVSGTSGGWPHLHFEVKGCSDCGSIPVNFSNAAPPNPNGLQQGVEYTALPY